MKSLINKNCDIEGKFPEMLGKQKRKKKCYQNTNNTYSWCETFI